MPDASARPTHPGPASDSPTVRALRALDLLQRRPGVTASELAEHLGVSERAVRRTIATLREADVPVGATSGPGGGYRLGRGVRLPPVVFSQTEALSLVMAVVDGRHEARDETQPVGAALAKLLRAMPDAVSQEATAVRDLAGSTPDRRAARPDPAAVSLLVGAVATTHCVELDYRTESGRVLRDVVEPHAVVARHGRWYLLCHARRVDAVRTYRLDRVTAAQVATERFTPPAEIDPVAALEEHLGRGWRYPTAVLVHAPRQEVAPWVGGSWGEITDHPQGCLLRGTTQNPAMYAGEYLARLPFAFTVLEGPELAEAVRELAGRLAAAVGDAAGPPTRGASLRA